MTYFDLDWSHKFDFGRPRDSTLRGVCIHTTENQPGASATAVADYQIRTRSGSYHVLVDSTGTRLRANTDDWETWSTGNLGNDVLLHLSFVFFAGATREQWLQQDKMLNAGAGVVAHWLKTYNFPLKWCDDVDELPGITTHDACREWGSTDHWDPGPGFPHDVFLDKVRRQLNPPTPVKEPDMPDPMTTRVRSRYRTPDGTQSTFQDSPIGYILENDAKLTRLTDDILPSVLSQLARLESKLDDLTKGK